VNGAPGNVKKGAVLANGDPGKPREAEMGDSRWHSRGYLPHFDSPGALQHIAYHLADSISQNVVERLHSEIVFLPDSQRDAERRKRLEAWIDSGHGSCALRDPVAAGIVQASFLNFDTQRYRLLAWVVMPNHVHVLIEAIHGWTAGKIVATWKKFTARLINEHLTAHGQKPLDPFWHREYWDRFMRDEGHFQQTIAYIHNNPVKAGLAASPEQWPWSSAFPRNAEHQFDKRKGAIQANGVPST
jgi:putative transposase